MSSAGGAASTTPLIVLDTNVLVSGLLTAHGPPGQIVDLAVAGLLRLAFDDRVLDEYRRVTARPRFALDPHDVALVLDALVAGGVPVVARPTAVALPDPEDLPFVEVALAARADALVTGNARHYLPTTGTLGVSVRSPRAFLEVMRPTP